MNNITLGKYITLKNPKDYDSLLTHVKGVNLFNGVKFNSNDITYKEMRSIIHLLKTGKDWESLYSVFNIMYKCTRDEFNYCSILEFYQCRNYIIKYVKDSQNKESKLLKSIGVDVELWRQAGGDKLNVFSNIMPLNQLGSIYNLYPYSLENKPYAEILTLLVLNKRLSEVDASYNKLKQKAKI